MQWTNLDRITRAALRQSQLPIHYYMEFLGYIVDNLRELRLHTLGQVNVKTLPIGPSGSVELPCDFVDWVKIYVPQGQFARPLIVREGISAIQKKDTGGNPIPYGVPVTSTDGAGIGIVDTIISDNDEIMGRWYGLRQGEQQDTFRIIREQNRIQLHESLLSMKELPLEYISSGEGEEEDTATKIDWRAAPALENYATWQHALRTKNPITPSLEKQYWNRVRILRAQTGDTSEEEILRIVRDAYSSSIKG
jgi:hypothetical protein